MSETEGLAEPSCSSRVRVSLTVAGQTMAAVMLQGGVGSSWSTQDILGIYLAAHQPDIPELARIQMAGHHDLVKFHPIMAVLIRDVNDVPPKVRNLACSQFPRSC